MKSIWAVIGIILLVSCGQKQEGQADNQPDISIRPDSVQRTSLVVLGTVQDAGSPQIGCKQRCCLALFKQPDHTRKVVSLGLIDTGNRQTFLFEATPDIAEQLKTLSRMSGLEDKEFPDGVFLTHAHIGHYSGLMFFGVEAANTSELSIYGMSRMRSYIETNGPWSQLLTKKNIRLIPVDSQKTLELNSNFKVMPILVPHRDEFSETVGYIIHGPRKKALFIPDIDKWSYWETDINKMISQVDYAFLDATFYHPEELNTRDLSEVLHPFVEESMERFEALSETDKKKVYFIHFNHTNPLLDSQSKPYNTVISSGFNIAGFGQTFDL